jgi:2-methylcitrate synthase
MSEFKKGLEGVIFDESAISKASSEAKSLYYRGYNVNDLAENCSFEEVAFLLLNKDLPNQKELAEFTALERANRNLPDKLLEVIKLFPKNAHPMDAVRTAVSYLGMEDEFKDGKDNYLISVKFLAKIATIVAACSRIKSGKKIIAPNSSLSFSENFFQMCFEKVPETTIVKAFDLSLILYAEHGFNASTFVARCTVSSLSDICAGITSAIGSLKGPLHGGANEAVMYMLQEVQASGNGETWIKDALAQKKKVMGFGHRIYRLGDSRVPMMKKYRDLIADITNNQQLVINSNILEETMVREKNIFPNLDFPAGPTYYMMGFEIELFTPIFVMARTSGWCAHLLEQLADNRLVRPSSKYTGILDKPLKPLSLR